MIENLLKKFGYIQESKAWQYVEPTTYDYTVDDLCGMLAEHLGIQDDIDDEYERKIFKDLKGTDGLVQYLRESAARDKDRYFGAATKEEQLIIRGAFARTAYLMSKVMNADKPKDNTKVEPLKYN